MIIFDSVINYPEKIIVYLAIYLSKLEKLSLMR